MNKLENEEPSVKNTIREYRNLSKDIRAVRKEMAEEGKELPSKNAFRREVIRRMFSIKADSASHEEIRDRLIAGGHVSGTNMVVMVCAILIASVGLNTNSTAVIIGAMLISPLMGSILAMSYGTASADYQIVGRHATGFAFQIIFSVITSTIYFLLSPDKAPTSELLARTSPSFFDVIIACAGGVSGIIGQTRKDKSNNIIPGVAIATALMPPLCTCGYSIANGRWRMLSGAAYLFLLNAYFIYLSACIVLSILQIPHVVEVPENVWKKKKRKMIRNTVLVTLPTILVMVHFTYTA